MQALSTAAPGKVYTIKWMFGLPEVLDIRVFKKFNGGLIIGNKHKRIAISDDAAARIQV